MQNPDLPNMIHWDTNVHFSDKFFTEIAQLRTWNKHLSAKSFEKKVIFTVYTTQFDWKILEAMLGQVVDTFRYTRTAVIHALVRKKNSNRDKYP